MLTDLTKLERSVLALAFTGDSSAMVALRAQAAMAKVSVRRVGGAGFSATIVVPHDVVVSEDASYHVSNIEGKHRLLRHGAGFAVFVEHGRLTSVEGFTYDEPWPDENSEDFVLEYVHLSRNQLT
jgi:hypothetical protein